MKKQMKSLNWIARIKQKFDNELTFKCVVIERWQHEFKRKFEMFSYLKKKSIVFIENCKKSRKRDWMIHFQVSIDCWWKWMIDVIARQIEKAIKFSIATRREYWWSVDLNTRLIEELICRETMWMMSSRLHTNHRLNDAINCYA